MKRKILPKSALFIFAALIYIVPLYAQETIVSGTITSGDDGSPLQGVTVTVLETSKHTITDAKGKYKISVPNGKAKISFSYTRL